MFLSVRSFLRPRVFTRLGTGSLSSHSASAHVDEVTLSPAEFRKKHQIKVSNIDPDDPQFAPIVSFDTAPLNKHVMKVLNKLGFVAPTATQSQSWPVATSGKDLISVARTGSGKTLGYLTPAFSKLIENKTYSRDPKILVIAPTRELCMQIYKECSYFEKLGIRPAACYGGVSRLPQLKQIRRGVDIIVATPGRCNDFLESGQLSVRDVDYVVLDEADRMLDM